MGKSDIRAIFPLFLAMLVFLAVGCAHQRPTYVLFAENARDDSAMEHAPTIRLPFEDQPVGARIICEDGMVGVWAMKLDDRRVRVRDPDGLERVLELPKDGVPVGLVIFWPQGTAKRCGLAPDSPVGSYAFWMWRQLMVRMRKLDAGKMVYLLGEESLLLSDPMSDADRRQLLEATVPERLVKLMH